MCLNHPASVQKHPTHLASSVMVRSVDGSGKRLTCTVTGVCTPR